MASSGGLPQDIKQAEDRDPSSCAKTKPENSSAADGVIRPSRGVVSRSTTTADQDRGGEFVVVDQIREERRASKALGGGVLPIDVVPRLLFASLLDASFDSPVEDDIIGIEDDDELLLPSSVATSTNHHHHHHHHLNANSTLLGYDSSTAASAAAVVSTDDEVEGRKIKTSGYGVPTVASLAALNEAYRMYDLQKSNDQADHPQLYPHQHEHPHHHHHHPHPANKPLNLDSNFDQRTDSSYSANSALSPLPPLSSIQISDQPQQQQQQQQQQQSVLSPPASPTPQQQPLRPFLFSRRTSPLKDAETDVSLTPGLRLRFFSRVDVDDDDDDDEEDDDAGFGGTPSVTVY